MNPDAQSQLDQSDWDLAMTEADTFLTGGRTALAVSDDDAEAFLTTERPDEPEVGRWFTSRYDGTCSKCFADYGEGEEIRADGEGGWQARECCGEPDDALEPEEAAARQQRRAERPRRDAPGVPIERGRYVMPHPTKRRAGKPTAWRATRMTTFVKLAADHAMLTKWELRSALVGLTLTPELLLEIADLLPDGANPADVVKAQKDALNAMVDRAKTAAGSSERSRHGTVLHKHTEEVDGGRRTLEQIPELYREDAAAYVAELERRGYRPVPELIERTTTVIDLSVMGTMDRVLLCPDGKYRIGDVKSGDDPTKYAFLEIAAQLAGYQRGFNETGVAQWSGEGNPKDWTTWEWARPVDEAGREIHVEDDFAIVMHVPFGSGRCDLYEVDLEEGRRELAACDLVRSRQRVKSLAAMRPLRDLEITDGDAVSAPQPDPAPEPHHGDMLALVAEEVSRQRELTWEERFAAVTTREEASALYQLARADVQELGVSRLMELVAIGKKALANQPPR